MTNARPTYKDIAIRNEEAIGEIRHNIEDLKVEVKSLNSRFNLIIILLVVAVMERLPNLLQFILSGIGN